MNVDYVQSVRGDDSKSPLVLSAPHIGRLGACELSDDVVENFRFNSRRATETIGAGADVAVPYVSGFHLQTNHSRVWTKLPRVFADPNRNLLVDIDELSVEGTGPNGRAHGAIWRSSFGTVDDISDLSRARFVDLLRRPYTREEYDKIVRDAIFPYHCAIREMMQKRAEACGFSIFVDLHSFPGYAGTTMPEGRHKGAYVLGQPVQRGSFKDVSKGKMPDLIILANQDPDTGKIIACHHKIVEIISDVFEKAGLIVELGIGPFRGNTVGGPVLYGDPHSGHHALALELVAHDNLEPGRNIGTLDVNEDRVKELRPVYDKMFERLAALTADDVRM